MPEDQELTEKRDLGAIVYERVDVDDDARVSKTRDFV